jgi:hypothetical protein
MNEELWYVFTEEFYSAAKNERDPTVCDTLKDIMISKINQTQQTLYNLTFMGILKSQTLRRNE